MGKIGQSLRDARLEMEQILKVSEKLADNFSDQGGAGGGGGAVGTPTASPAPVVRQVINFNTTISQPLVGGGSGGAGGGSGSLNPANSQSDEFINFLRTRGIYDIQKANEQTIKALKQEFEFILRKLLGKSGGLDLRKMGMG